MLAATAALAFVNEHGVVLVSARGPVPTLTEAIAGEPIRGSWWGHRDGKQIFRVLAAVTDSGDVLACRLVGGKVTLVHRRLWPALVRAAGRFPARQVAQLVEEHTATGRHRTRETPFPEWVPQEVRSEADRLTVEEALSALGSWTLASRDAVGSEVP